MPDLPVVYVALTMVVVVVSTQGATGPVGSASGELGDDARQHLVIVEWAGDALTRVVPVDPVGDPLVLVVAAKEPRLRRRKSRVLQGRRRRRT